MGIISTLLSGGVLIGKVCQGLSSAFGQSYTDEKTGERITVSITQVCGVKFFQSASVANDSKNYAFNTNSNYDVSVVFPNDSSGNGVAYDIPATMKIDVTGDLATNHTPDKEILIGPCCDSANADKTAAKHTPIIKLSLNNMKIGGDPVYISDYGISCDTEGIKVKSQTRDLGALSYFNMISDTGVLLSNQSSIDKSESNGGEYTYKIDMEKFGLKKGDILNGQIHIEMGADNNGSVFGSSLAEPLTETEKRCFKKLGII